MGSLRSIFEKVQKISENFQKFLNFLIFPLGAEKLSRNFSKISKNFRLLKFNFKKSIFDYKVQPANQTPASHSPDPVFARFARKTGKIVLLEGRFSKKFWKFKISKILKFWKFYKILKFYKIIPKSGSAGFWGPTSPGWLADGLVGPL